MTHTSDANTVKRYLPWVVAVALFMEQLDSTIINTAIPAMAESLQVTPLSLKAVVTSYILSLAVGIPISGWMADRYVMNNDRFFEESNGLYSAYNQSKRLLYDRWKKPGDLTDIPRYGVVAQLDDRFLENASFLRLKNLTLAYVLPQPILKKTNFFTSARIYLQGQNLLTFTGFNGLDPEVASNIYRAQYPASRQYTLGIEVSF